MGSNPNQDKQARFGGNQSSTLTQILMGYNPNQEEQAGLGGLGGDNMHQYIPSLQIASTPGGSLINATSATINSGGTSSGFNDNGVGRASSSNPQASMNKRNGSHQKQRFIWTQEHHQSFLEVIELLETQNGTSNRKVVPRKILEEMRKRYPNITRENIASHLQSDSILLQSFDNHMENDSTLQQGFDNQMENGSTLQQGFDNPENGSILEQGQGFDNQMENDSILYQGFDSFMESDSILMQSFDNHMENDSLLQHGFDNQMENGSILLDLIIQWRMVHY
ncbi:putative two-component response regulator-like APRR4, partial [Cucurbita argyrosperma subsp. sororia]